MESSISTTASSNAEYLESIPRKSFKELYILGSKMGEGSFGIVFEATRKSDQKQLAVKVVKNRPTADDVEECIFMSKV